MRTEIPGKSWQQALTSKHPDLTCGQRLPGQIWPRIHRPEVRQYARARTREEHVNEDVWTHQISGIRMTYTCLFKRCLISAFCPINRFCIRTTFLGKPEYLLIYWCQTRFSAANMPDQTEKIPDQTEKIPDHVGWQFLTISARTATILVFLRSGRNKYHMEDPGMSTNAGLNAYMHIQGPSITAARLGVWPCDNATI